MKTILCFGDSNTWGYDPTAGTPLPSRHPRLVRWTGVLASELGDGWRVIEEGQNGRTTVHEDPFYPSRNGRVYLPACLESHKPIDLVVMMLGTNDLKSVHQVPAGEIAAGAGVLARMILGSDAGPANKAPKLLLVCPPKVANLTHLPDLAAKFPQAETKSAEFPRHYSALAQSLGCGFLNSQEIVVTSELDGLHLTASEHGKLGRAIAAKVRSMT